MYKNSKNHFINEITEELIIRFNQELTQELIDLINKHLYHYDLIKNENALIVADEKTEQILKMFIGTKRLEGKAEGILKQYYREIRLLLGFLNCSIDKVQTAGIKYYLSEMKIQKNLQNSTLENMRCYISSVFTWCFMEKYIEENPCTGIKPIKIEQKVRKSFSKNELKRIKKVCKNNKRDLAIINFLYSTGCRVSEIVNLNKEDINFNKKEVIVLGKGNKERIVYLNQETIETLYDYLKSREDNNEALFLNKKKSRLQAGGIRWILHGLENKSGVENIYPHRFRRTLATDLLNAGMAIADVAKILGHANVKITQVYYDQTNEKVKNEYYKYID